MNLTKRGCLLCGSKCGVEGCAVCERKSQPCRACTAKYHPDELERLWGEATIASRRRHPGKP